MVYCIYYCNKIRIVNLFSIEKNQDVRTMLINNRNHKLPTLDIAVEVNYDRENKYFADASTFEFR